MEKNVKISVLCDLYGNLLTEKQFEFIDDYYNKDLSLSEIAENKNITRQAVRDNIKKGEKKLFEYEEKLRLIQKFNHIREMLKEIRQTTCLLEKCGEVPETKKILKLLDDIMEEL